jgi:hypothetical protein
MKNIFKLFIAFSFLFLFQNGFAQVNPSNHFVRTYTKSNGTVVEGHYQTNPNATNRDNYSTYPNTNPYTGKAGTVQPDNNYTTYPTYTPAKTYTPTYPTYTPTTNDNNTPQ